MVLMEMSIVPLGTGDSVSQQVADCIDLVDRSGLDYEVHSMGTIIEGELADVLQVLQACVDKMAEYSDRVSCSAKIDYRRGYAGRLAAKVDSIEKHLGRQVNR